MLIDLHSHLEGRVRPDTAAELAADLGVPAPAGGWPQAIRLEGPADLTVYLTKVAATYPLFGSLAAVEKEGGDAFQDLTLPSTALRLKQGFGRLIRRATDTGRVTLLDPRVVTKRYGRFLLESLPECPTDVVRGPGEEEPVEPAPEPIDPGLP